MYDFLFYKAYKQVERSRNFIGMEILGASLYVSLCFFLNVLTVLFVLDAVGLIFIKGLMDSKYGFLIPIALLFIVWIYYKYVRNAERIVEKQEQGRSVLSNAPGWVVFFIYYLGSSLLLLLASMYKNGNGIFS